MRRMSPGVAAGLVRGLVDEVLGLACCGWGHGVQERRRPAGTSTSGCPTASSTSSTPGHFTLIENGDGTVFEALDQPRSSFAGHEFETPWSTLQLAYLVGTAMWTYLTQPFTFAMPDSTRAS